MREIVLAAFDNNQPGRLMNRIEAETYGDTYLNAKLISLNPSLYSLGIIETITVQVHDVELRPERPALAGYVIALCEVAKKQTH